MIDYALTIRYQAADYATALEKARHIKLSCDLTLGRDTCSAELSTVAGMVSSPH